MKAFVVAVATVVLILGGFVSDECSGRDDAVQRGVKRRSSALMSDRFFPILEQGVPRSSLNSRR